ncbi:hypothetical protein ACSBR2_015615 [Camellia fascicularis]
MYIHPNKFSLLLSLSLSLYHRLTIVDSLFTITVGLPPSFTLDLPLSRIITSPLLLALLRFNIEGKGTWSFGKRRNKTHILCVRCGRRSFHLQKSRCSACAFLAARKGTYHRSVKAIQRKTTGTGQMRYLRNVPRRFKSRLREGATSHPLTFFNRVNFIFICMMWLIFISFNLVFNSLVLFSSITSIHFNGIFVVKYNPISFCLLHDPGIMVFVLLQFCLLRLQVSNYVVEVFVARSQKRILGYHFVLCVLTFGSVE